jgi:hypothetical protein
LGRLCLVVFHLGLIFSGLVPNLVSRPLHMALALPWICLFVEGGPVLPGDGRVLGGSGWRFVSTWPITSALDDQYGFLEGDLQMRVAVVLLACVLEMARRAIGWPLPTDCRCWRCIYGLFGQHIPGEFGHPGLPLESFLGTLTIAEGGIWGSLTGVSVSVVAVFVIFGAVLNAGEAGQGFMNVAPGRGRPAQGGAAKVSVLVFGAVRLHLRLGVCQCGLDRCDHAAGHDTARLSAFFAAAVEAVASRAGRSCRR